jgi:hypothetical protein
MTMAAASVGDNVGIFRWLGNGPRDGVQLGLLGGIFAQFDLSSPSNDLVNADYVIGIPITWRHRRLSARASIYHQSSHLGDEYLLTHPVERINLSFEAVTLLLSGEAGAWRLYGGGEYLVHHDPSDLGNGIAQGGAEYRGRTTWLNLGGMGRGRPVIAVDLRSWQQHHWMPGLSVNAGLRFLSNRSLSQWSGRSWSVLGVLYYGPSPYGQFYSETVRYLGMALQLGF